jgi:hypothetical protein
MPRPAPAVELGAALAAALVRELARTWADLNATFFRRRLRPPAIELSDATTRLGRWVPGVRTIEIARSLVLDKPWGVVVEVLKHEMAHQYVHEVENVVGEAAHGPAFRALCDRLGIDGSATGLPADAGDPGSESARVLERIRKLLALADSPNANEAEAAMAAAQRLMLKYNLDAAAARGDAGVGYAFRHLGQPSGRTGEHERLVAAILAEHFFVEVIWVPVYRPLEGRHGSVLEICGTTENLEMASYVHAYLLHAAERLWREHKRARGIRGDRDRRTYLAGVMAGFLEKLRAQRKQSRAEGLVWVRDADLEGFYRRRHPRIQHVRTRGPRRTEAHAHGREAGRSLEIHRPVGGGSGGAPRMLPPKG